MRAGGGDLLVFDENADTDKEVTGVLQSGSFDVRLCTSQSELFASIKSRKPALVLLSLTRAESSGLQTLKQLRESYATLPVVVVANDAATHQVVPCLEAGADDYVLVPLKDERILHYVLEQTIARRRESKRRRRNERELAKSNRTLLSSLGALEEDQQAGFRVQQGMMPDTPVSIDVLSLSHFLKPSLILSGDCIDYFELPDGRVLFYIADVSGHGAAGAIVTVLLKGLFHRLVAEFDPLPTDSSAEIMSWLNDEILAANLEQHVAMFLGLINRGRDMLEYTNAGHFPGTILRTEQETVYLELGGLPLGISPVPGYDFQRVSLPVPSELVMFSDGVFEILGEESLEAKEKHLLSLVKGTSGEVDSLAENLGLHEVAEVPDDIAIFTVAKTG